MILIKMIERMFVEDKITTNMNMNNVFKKVNHWLRFKGLSIVEESPPKLIKAIHKGGEIEKIAVVNPGLLETTNVQILNFPIDVEPLVDPYPKDIEVKISDLGEKKQVRIRVMQSEKRLDYKGLPYWVPQFNELRKFLGVETEFDTSPIHGILTKRVQVIKRNYAGLIGGSLLAVIAIFGVRLDILLTYLLVFVAPITAFMGSEYNQLKEMIGTS